MADADHLAAAQDDGLYAPEIGSWGRLKYSLVASYCRTFATAMKRKWNDRVYIDLFAGAGMAKLKDTGCMVWASPMRALQVVDPFDRYVFCEKDAVALQALRMRVERCYPSTDVRYVPGDVNTETPQVLAHLPQHGPSHKVLTLCFADPYKLGNLAFQTIRALAARFVDFLVLIPTDMDANRNVSCYVDAQNIRIERFLGNPDWRQEWESARGRNQSFGVFLADHFGRQMQTLGYIHRGVDQMPLIRSTRKNLPLYRLALFSRHELGAKFWAEARKYGDPQIGLL